MQKELATADFPKDVAALANVGDGVPLFGVMDESRWATGRVRPDEITETHECTLRQVRSKRYLPVVGRALSSHK